MRAAGVRLLDRGSFVTDRLITGLCRANGFWGESIDPAQSVLSRPETANPHNNDLGLIYVLWCFLCDSGSMGVWVGVWGWVGGWVGER